MSDDHVFTLGNQRGDGARFLLAPTGVPAPSPPGDTKSGDVTHVATDDVGRVAHIRQALLAQIGGARAKVEFCSYLFADDEIVKALCQAAERLRGGVYVLTALGNHLKAEALDLDAEPDTGNAKEQGRAERHEGHLKRLAHAGVWLRSAEGCHAKFCVVDDEHALVTSANATQEAYESNPENALLVADPGVGHELGALFSYVWQHRTSLESTPGSLLDVRSLPPRRAPDWRAMMQASRLGAVATIDSTERSLLRAAIEVIDGAHSELTIATYSLIGMERHALGQALQRAVERGVGVEVLVQPRDHVVAQRKTCQWLLGLAPTRVRLVGHRRTHTKSMVADSRDLLLWTGNLEATYGWEKGIEVGLRVRDEGVATAVRDWTRAVMARATHVPVVAPSAAELVSRGASARLGGAWTLKLPPAVSSRSVAASLQQGPVEVLEDEKGAVLRCDDQVLLDVTIDEANHCLRCSRLRRGEWSRVRSTGWVMGCTLCLVEETAKAIPRARRSTARGRRSRRGRR